jgi:hypothetical protein
MPHEVRLSDPEAVEDLFNALHEAGADVRRRGARTIAVYGSDDDLETELRFFVRAWALSRPALTIELDRVAFSR